jgi:5'-methylthioadenosine phosphorylase
VLWTGRLSTQPPFHLARVRCGAAESPLVPGGQAPRDGGVYWQARGPRFETPAEIRLMAAHADVVGMTIATECVVAGELGLDYAALCVVDNLANGLAAEEVSTAGMEADRLINAERLREGLEAVLPRLGAVGR